MGGNPPLGQHYSSIIMARFGYHLCVWSGVLLGILVVYVFYDGDKRRRRSDALADVGDHIPDVGILGSFLLIGWLLTTLHWSRPPMVCWCVLPLLVLLSVVGYLMWSTSFPPT